MCLAREGEATVCFLLDWRYSNMSLLLETLGAVCGRGTAPVTWSRLVELGCCCWTSRSGWTRWLSPTDGTGIRMFLRCSRWSVDKGRSPRREVKGSRGESVKWRDPETSCRVSSAASIFKECRDLATRKCLVVEPERDWGRRRHSDGDSSNFLVKAEMFPISTLSCDARNEARRASLRVRMRTSCVFTNVRRSLVSRTYDEH